MSWAEGGGEETVSVLKLIQGLGAVLLRKLLSKDYGFRYSSIIPSVIQGKRQLAKGVQRLQGLCVHHQLQKHSAIHPICTTHGLHTS